MNKRGMTLSKGLTKKVDNLVHVVSEETGFTLTRMQVLESVIDSELDLRSKPLVGGEAPSAKGLKGTEGNR